MASQIDSYIESLRDRMSGKFARRTREEILSEARTHLEDESLELVAQGTPLEVAEKEAIRRFGDADQVNQWYLSAHQIPSIWRAALWPVVILAAFVLVTQYLPVFMLPGVIGSMIVYINLTLVSMIWACFRAKRLTLPVTIPAIALYSVGLFVYFCAFCVPKPGEHGMGIVTRGTTEQHVQEAKIDLAKSESRRALLTKGYEVFRPTYEPVQVPPEFKTAEGYTTPMYFQMKDSAILSVYLDGVPTSGMMSSWSEARQFWENQPTSLDPRTKQQVPYFLAEASTEIMVSQRVIDEMPTLMKTSWRDHVRLYALAAVMNGFLPLYFAVIGDLFGSLLRWAKRVWRKRRGSSRLAA